MDSNPSTHWGPRSGPQIRSGDVVEGVVIQVGPHAGVFVTLDSGATGLVEFHDVFDKDHPAMLSAPSGYDAVMEYGPKPGARLKFVVIGEVRGQYRLGLAGILFAKHGRKS